MHLRRPVHHTHFALVVADARGRVVRTPLHAVVGVAQRLPSDARCCCRLPRPTLRIGRDGPPQYARHDQMHERALTARVLPSFVQGAVGVVVAVARAQGEVGAAGVQAGAPIRVEAVEIAGEFEGGCCTGAMDQVLLVDQSCRACGCE
jgi:hypothetical protein